MDLEKRELGFKEAKETEDNYILTGLFIVFNSPSLVRPGRIEEIAPEAINLERDLKGEFDIAALLNHDDNIPLARASNGTLKLWKDEVGVWAEIQLNKEDSDAKNLYERVKRKDVSGNSCGFIINEEKIIETEDGKKIHRITDLTLIEISPCTFPAYRNTFLETRNIDVDDINSKLDQILNYIKNIEKNEEKRKVRELIKGVKIDVKKDTKTSRA